MDQAMLNDVLRESRNAKEMTQKQWVLHVEGCVMDNIGQDLLDENIGPREGLISSMTQCFCSLFEPSPLRKYTRSQRIEIIELAESICYFTEPEKELYLSMSKNGREMYLREKERMIQRRREQKTRERKRKELLGSSSDYSHQDIKKQNLYHITGTVGPNGTQCLCSECAPI